MHRIPTAFCTLLVITCITIQSISVLYDTNNKLLLFVSQYPPPNIHTVHQDWARQLPFPDYEYQCVHTVQLQDMLVSSVAKTVKKCEFDIGFPSPSDLCPQYPIGMLVLFPSATQPTK